MFEFSPETGFLGLFVAAFISATVLPGGSEVVLVGVLAKYPDAFWKAIAVATVGNTLGGLTSYFIGRRLPEGKNLAKGSAVVWLKKYGAWSLLLSWVPLFGDALCVAAGWLRINVWLSLALFAVGKFLRYLVVAGGWAWFARAMGWS